VRRFLSYDLHCTFSPFFILYIFSSLFISASCSLNALCFLCSKGVKSGVMNIFLYNIVLSALNLNLFLKIQTFSTIDPIVILSRRDLSDPLLPILTALLIVNLIFRVNLLAKR